MQEIKKLLGSEKLLIGTESVLKALRAKKLDKVLTAKNCKESVLTDLEKYVALAETKLEQLDLTNEELGTFCKKPFSVSVLGVLK